MTAEFSLAFYRKIRYFRNVILIKLSLAGKMNADFDTTTQEYVEIIYELQKNNKVARVKEIAERRGVSRSSVSIALNLLKKKKLIEHENYGLVELTDTGMQLGKELEQRHQIIRDFFVNILNIEPEIAENDACKLEHYIHQDIFNSLVDFVAFMNENSEWAEKFKQQ